MVGSKERKERTQREGKGSKIPAQQTLETLPSAAMPPVGWSSHWEFIGKGMVGMPWQARTWLGLCWESDPAHLSRINTDREAEVSMLQGCSGVGDWTQKRLILHRSSGKGWCPEENGGVDVCVMRGWPLKGTEGRETEEIAGPGFPA